MRICKVVIVCSLVFALGITNAFKVDTPSEVIKILDSPLYDKYATPNQVEGETTHVQIAFYIEGMSSIRAQTMDFQIDIYFEQKWIDKRLAHNSTSRILVKDLGIFEKMWHPDIYFANAKSANFFTVMAPNFFLWIFPNGTVHHDCRISLTVLCNMDLTKYPLDAQKCDMRILSYAYTSDQLNITWRGNNPITKNDQLKLPDMMITDSFPSYCNGDYSDLGNWSCLLAVFILQREIMYHILQSYIPTMLIVVISWFSFWLDIDAVPGRVSLCITTLLTLATQASSAKLALPQVSYAKAIDVWMEACLGMVFGVLIEFTFVNYLSRRHKEVAAFSKRKNICNGGKTDLNINELNDSWNPASPLNNSLDYAKSTLKEQRKLALKVDRVCRVLFPAFFAVFNILYWMYYLHLS